MHNGFAPPGATEPHPLLVLLNLSRALRYRKRVFFAALTASFLLGGLYYVMVPRTYEVEASLLVQPMGADFDQSPEGFLRTCQDVLRSDMVLQEAIELLPPQDQIDLVDTPDGEKVDVLRQDLSVNVVRRSTIMEITYRSRDRRAGTAVVQAVLSAYLESLNKIYSNLTREIFDTLVHEKGDLEKELVAIEAELLVARNQLTERANGDGDGNDDGDSSGNQNVQVALTPTRSVVESVTRTRRQNPKVEMQLKAIEAAISAGENHDTIQKRIEALDLGQDNGKIRTSIINPPKASIEAVSPRLGIVVLLSLIFGLGGGLGIVYVQDVLDDRFRTPEELQAQLGAPVLAEIHELQPFDARAIHLAHVRAHPNDVETEAFRSLRASLEFAAGDRRCLIVSSCRAGDGKTAIVANLAAAFAQAGRRTLLIDANLRNPGLVPKPDLFGPHGLSIVLADEVPVRELVEDNLSCSPGVENLDILPSGPCLTNTSGLLGCGRFAELLSWAETRYDQILIDGPTALTSDVAMLGQLVDGVLLVVQPHKNRRPEVARVVERLSLLGIDLLGSIVNHQSHDVGIYCDYPQAPESVANTRSHSRTETPRVSATAKAA